MAKAGDRLTFLGRAIILDGKIKAAGGGAIGCGNGTTVELTNSTLTGNQATKGGGVYVSGSSATFTMKGTSCVISAPDKNDVYLDGGAKITVADTLPPQGGIAARITVPNDQYQTTTQVLTGSITDGTPQNYTKFTVTPQTSPAKKWMVGEQGKLAEVIGSSASSPTDKWIALKTAVESATDGGVFYIEGEYTMLSGSNTIEPTAPCTIKGTNDAVLNADNKGTMISVTSPSPQNMSLENLTIKNGKNDKFALSASWGFKFHLKNVTVKDTKKIIESNSGDVTFENVKAYDTDSIIKLGGGTDGSGKVHYACLEIKGDTEIKGTVKLISPYNSSDYNSAIKICDKKSYKLQLDFDGYYDTAKDKQVVFLDTSVTGFTLAQAVEKITVKSNGSDQYYIDNNGYLKKKP